MLQMLITKFVLMENLTPLATWTMALTSHSEVIIDNLIDLSNN